MWQVVSAGGPTPPGRFAHSATVILERDLYIFGGTNGTTDFATTYRFRPADPLIPEPRARHVTVYDPIRQRMILWGGDDGLRLFDQDVWAMSLQPGTAPSWSKLDVTVPEGITLGTRGAAAAFDTQRGVMYVHGGAPAMNTMPFGELLQLSFPNASSAVWSRPETIGTVFPGNRMFHSMAYDSAGDRLYLFGGWDGYEILGGTKQMTPGLGPGQDEVQWADVAVSPAPEPRYGYISYFESKPNRRRFTIMGGEGNPSGGGSIGQVWGLSVAGTPTWAPICGGPWYTGNLWFGSAAYRNYGDRTYLTGGWFNPTNVWSNQLTHIGWLYDDPQTPCGWGWYQFANAPSNHIYQHTSIFD